MIKLCDNWYLDAGDNEYQLVNWGGETRTDKDGREYRISSTTYYYSDLSIAMKHLFVHLVRQGIQATESLEGLKTMIDNRYALVSELCAKVIPEIDI